MRFERPQGFAWVGAALAGLTAAAIAMAPSPAKACGGFFCSAANPVNQAAEQIVFSKNADGTVTAVIQIMYDGPSQKFAWVLPVPGNPTVAVSSDSAFQALKQATNPQYTRQTMFDGSCAVPMATGAVGFGNASGTGGAASAPAVTVVASGAVGPYDYDVIMVDPGASDAAQVAVDWLTAHSYDVGPMGDVVLRPYLEDGLNLLAFKLSKGNMTGSIRPVMITYDSALPSIPIRPTAVAANDDMGVLVWVLSDARAIPENYKALELNEALIDWFNPNNNYNEVVSKAADEAMGQGFVTEYAGKVSDLVNNTGVQIFAGYQQQQWNQFQATSYTDAASMVRDATNMFGNYDGFNDALQASVTLPSNIAFSDFQRCLSCYINAAGVTFDTQTFLTKLYEMVIKPLADTQALLDSRPYITRLYTTMSAAEMTLDPAFDFNSDLGDVSNIHTADFYIECGNGGGTSNSPWRLVLPQGGEVHGTTIGTWPIMIDSQPAALKILQYGKQGQGKVIDDRTDMIVAMLKQNGAGTSDGGTADSGTGGTSGGSTGGKSGGGGSAGSGGSSGGTSDAGVDDGGKSGSSVAHSGGCNVGGGLPEAGGSGSLLLLALAALIRRRRF